MGIDGNDYYRIWEKTQILQKKTIMEMFHVILLYEIQCEAFRFYTGVFR